MSATRERGMNPMSEFADSRARAEQEQADQRGRAVRTVAQHSRDQQECADLLSMLGLSDVDGASVLSRSLAGYVKQVAGLVGVPAEAVGHEVSDTATAYLGLADRFTGHPTRDLMLVWDERLGWYIGVEPHAGESTSVLCYLGGEAVPAPAAVARFVSGFVAGQGEGKLMRPTLPPADRAGLAARMVAQCAAGAGG